MKVLEGMGATQENDFVFSGKPYREIVSRLVSLARPVRGCRSKLAKAIGCRLSYLSQVLGGQASFSLEQADACCTYFSFSLEEREYFQLLVQRERAGTASLRQFFQKKITQAQAERKKIDKRVKVGMPLSGDGQALYYSTWEYAAVHVACAMDESLSIQGIASHTGIAESRAREVAKDLCAMGLVEEENGAMKATNTRIHLSGDGPHIVRHHSNWRLQAIRAAESRKPDDLLYSSVISVSAEDYAYLRELLLGKIAEIKSRVRQSEGEKLVGFNVDFFSMPHA